MCFEKEITGIFVVFEQCLGSDCNVLMIRSRPACVRQIIMRTNTKIRYMQATDEI